MTDEYRGLITRLKGDLEGQQAFGRRLQALRLGRGLSVYALAAASGMDRTHLARIESGDVDPSVGVLRKLSSVFSRADVARAVFPELD